MIPKNPLLIAKFLIPLLFDYFEKNQNPLDSNYRNLVYIEKNYEHLDIDYDVRDFLRPRIYLTIRYNSISEPVTHTAKFYIEKNAESHEDLINEDEIFLTLKYRKFYDINPEFHSIVSERLIDFLKRRRIYFV